MTFAEGVAVAFCPASGQFVRNNHSFSSRYLALNTREKVTFVLVYIFLHCERALVVVVTL